MESSTKKNRNVAKIEERGEETNERSNKRKVCIDLRKKAHAWI